MIEVHENILVPYKEGEKSLVYTWTDDPTDDPSYAKWKLTWYRDVIDVEWTRTAM